MKCPLCGACDRDLLMHMGSALAMHRHLHLVHKWDDCHVRTVQECLISEHGHERSALDAVNYGFDAKALLSVEFADIVCRVETIRLLEKVRS